MVARAGGAIVGLFLRMCGVIFKYTYIVITYVTKGREGERYISYVNIVLVLEEVVEGHNIRRLVVVEEVEHTSGLVKEAVFATETPPFYGAHEGSQLYLIQNQVFSGQCFYHELPQWALELAW